jgi:anhydro-N-acetylmuramic acid kinase
MTAMSDICKFNVIGLMSGTSLDGVDIAYCCFTKTAEKWDYKIICAETLPYSIEWKNMLTALENTNALTFQQIHWEYGFFLGDLVNAFILKHNISADFIASHGHTIFHADFNTHILKNNIGNFLRKKLTVQIGSGAAIAAQSGITTVCDFRTMDVALGGQGAPLVPIGDELLFSEYDFCLNLGGFANISYKYQGQRIAYDVCPVNIVMNALCEKVGKAYDDGGKIASTGKINDVLFDELNNLSFYNKASDQPKSLGKEWIIECINPLLNKYSLSIEDYLRTIVEHIAWQVAKAINTKPSGKLLITGGGAFNTYLISAIQKQVLHQVIIPDKNTIEFKEALIFAFLGVLRLKGEVNCLKSVTGSEHNNIGGAVYAGRTK